MKSVLPMPDAVLFSSKKTEWETPAALFADLDREFQFTFDICASPENAKRDQYYTIDQDALKLPWVGRCFCNPPYGRKTIQWVAKADAEIQQPECEVIVMLLAARTDTGWFHRYLWDRTHHHARSGVSVRFLRGRLHFGGGEHPAPFPSLIAIWQ